MRRRNPSRRRGLAIVDYLQSHPIALIVMALGLTVLFFGLSTGLIAGNYPIRFYGRVVDDKNRGVAGVRVQFDIKSANFFRLPLPFADQSTRREEEVVTDSHGNFSLTSERGIFVSGRRVTLKGEPIFLVAINRPRDADPLYGVSLDQPPRRRLLPDSEEKRIIYRITQERTRHAAPGRP